MEGTRRLFYTSMSRLKQVFRITLSRITLPPHMVTQPRFSASGQRGGPDRSRRSHASPAGTASGEYDRRELSVNIRWWKLVGGGRWVRG